MIAVVFTVVVDALVAMGVLAGVDTVVMIGNVLADCVVVVCWFVIAGARVVVDAAVAMEMQKKTRWFICY